MVYQNNAPQPWRQQQNPFPPPLAAPWPGGARAAEHDHQYTGNIPYRDGKDAGNSLPPGAAAVTEDPALFREALEGMLKRKGSQTSSYVLPHPYAAHMFDWNAIKARAMTAGLVDSYGMPTEDFYKTEPKRDWMLQADKVNWEYSPLVDMYSKYNVGPDYALVTELTGTYAPKAGETFTQWTERVRPVFEGMLEEASGDLDRLKGLNNSGQAQKGAENMVEQLKYVLDELEYQWAFRDLRYAAALGPIASDDGLIRQGVDTLNDLVDTMTRLGYDTEGDLDMLFSDANANHIGMYYYLLQTEGGDAASEYILHVLPALRGKARKEAGGETGKAYQGGAYDPAALDALFAQGGSGSPKSVDVYALQDTLLAQYVEKGIMEEPTLRKLFYHVLRPDQWEDYLAANYEAMGMLDEEQRERYINGEDLFQILNETGQGEKFLELGQRIFSSLDPQQQIDLMFLGSGKPEGQRS